MLRSIGGTAAGIVVSVLVALAIMLAGYLVYPLPADAAMESPGSAGLSLDGAPFGAQLFVIAALFLAAFAGALVAGLISNAYWPGWIVAGVVAIGGLTDVLFVPFPVWMQIAAVAAPLLGGFAAHHVGPARRPEGSAR